MTTYELHLESGPQHKTTLVHVLELLGCVSFARTTEEAVAAAPEAIRAYLRYLRRHGERVDPVAPPRYVVRVSVPAGSLDDPKRLDMVQRVTAVLAGTEDDPHRLEREPVAWVHINEIPEGNWGARGRVVRFADIAAYVVGAGSAAPAGSVTAAAS